jgi:hypothetical protein
MRHSRSNETTSKWCHFFWCFRGFWPNGGSVVSKSGYPSAKEPYFDFELLFLVATAMRVEIRVLNVVLYSVICSKHGQTTEIAVNDFVPRKDHRR